MDGLAIYFKIFISREQHKLEIIEKSNYKTKWIEIS